MSFVLIVLYYKTLKLFFLNEDFQAEKYNFLMDH